VQRGGGDQRSGEAVQFGVTGAVIVVMRAVRANGIGVAIDEEQQAVAAGA